MELVYRFKERRQAGDAVIPLLDSPHVADVAVVVGQGYVLIGVKTAGKNKLDWVRGVLGLGTEVTSKFPDFLELRRLPFPPFLEVYRTKEGVKRFKGYSYRRKGQRQGGSDEPEVGKGREGA